MKKLLSILPLLALTTLGAQGQGYVLFANFTSNFSVEKHIYDAVTGYLLNSAFVAQLFAGPAGALEDVLTAIDSPVEFFDSPPESVGEFFAGEVQVAGVAPGATATLQVRVWPIAYATWAAAYAAAAQDPNIHVGKSATFQNTTGTSGSNVEIAVNMPVFTIGVVPEPSVIVLGLLGLGLPLLRRRS